MSVNTLVFKPLLMINQVIKRGLFSNVEHQIVRLSYI